MGEEAWRLLVELTQTRPEEEPQLSADAEEIVGGPDALRALAQCEVEALALHLRPAPEVAARAAAHVAALAAQAPKPVAIKWTRKENATRRRLRRQFAHASQGPLEPAALGAWEEVVREGHRLIERGDVSEIQRWVLERRVPAFNALERNETRMCTECGARFVRTGPENGYCQGAGCRKAAEQRRARERLKQAQTSRIAENEAAASASGENAAELRRQWELHTEACSTCRNGDPADCGESQGYVERIEQAQRLTRAS